MQGMENAMMGNARNGECKERKSREWTLEQEKMQGKTLQGMDNARNEHCKEWKCKE